MTAACAVDTVPSARAALVTGSDSCRAVARSTSAAALPPQDRVCAASHAEVPDRPARDPASCASAAATIVSLSDSSREIARSTSATSRPLTAPTTPASTMSSTACTRATPSITGTPAVPGEDVSTMTMDQH